MRGDADFQRRILTGVAGFQIRERLPIVSNVEMAVLSWCNSLFAGMIDQKLGHCVVRWILGVTTGHIHEL